jgi:REP element-mobilizing transposase RayT
MMKSDSIAVSFRELELNCELNFKKNPSYWHLFTDGRNSEIIFRDQSEMITGMNILAISCVHYSDVKVFTFELMNNHLHMILAGAKDRCEALFCMFKARLWRCFMRNGRTVELRRFNCELIEILSLQSLRNELAYVNRNGYVTHQDCTPFSYPWGAGAAFFSPLMKLLPSVSYDSLKVKQKREICRSNNVDIPSSKAMVYEEIILPASYCHIDEAEAFFRSAHHYFQHISRKFEAYSEIADRLHESVFISDEEMYSAVCALGLKMYNVKNPTLLGTKERIEMARQMRQKYNASNRQIRNILKLDNSIVDTLFPQPPH